MTFSSKTREESVTGLYAPFLCGGRPDCSSVRNESRATLLVQKLHSLGHFASINMRRKTHLQGRLLSNRLTPALGSGATGQTKIMKHLGSWQEAPRLSHSYVGIPSVVLLHLSLMIRPSRVIARIESLGSQDQRPNAKRDLVDLVGRVRTLYRLCIPRVQRRTQVVMLVYSKC